MGGFPALALACIWLSTSWLAAQERPPVPALGSRVDAVVATVNDNAILFSVLRTVAMGKIRTYESTVGPLPDRERDAIFRDVLEVEIDRRRMAQSAKTLGPLLPNQVDEVVKAEIERERQEQVRDLGSVTEFSRELKRIGRTWPSYEGEQRIDKLNELAEELAISRRLARQTNLLVTPRMLRETYQSQLPRFVRSAAAKVVQVRFAGKDAQANAEAAAKAWRTEAIDARQLAARFPDASPIGELEATSLSTEMAPLAEFALAGPVDSVSAPFPLRDAFFVAKVTAHLAARNGKFEDQDVQEEVRRICLERVVEEFRSQALERARQRTEVWRMPAYR